MAKKALVRGLHLAGLTVGFHGSAEQTLDHLKIDLLRSLETNAAFADAETFQCRAVLIKNCLLQDVQGDVMLLTRKRDFHHAVPFVNGHAIVNLFAITGQRLTAQATQLLQRELVPHR